MITILCIIGTILIMVPIVKGIIALLWAIVRPY